MLELKQLAGVLNTDDPYENVDQRHHVNARNIRFVNGQVQGIKGNSLISFSMPSGTNITIGNIYDDLYQRIFFFNYNSNDTHGIYMYTLSTNTIQVLVLNGVGTDGDIFQFTADSYFPDIRIIYGDSTQGDILYWLNSQKKPCKLNINRALGTLGSYGTIESTFLDVCKEIPQRPPAVTFEDDNTVTVNNFRKKLLKYKYRFVFDDKDKSAWSAHSEIPLPIGYTDSGSDFNSDPSKNSRVAIVVQTGKPNVKKIEIAACESVGNTFSDFFRVCVLDKLEDSIDDESLTTYRFYNDQAYTYIDVSESEQEFDWVPLEANAQETLNGNILAYGGILEGYNQIVSDAEATSGTNEDLKTTQFPFIFVATQSNNSGFGSGNILSKLIGQIPEGWTFHIITTNEDVSYTSVTSDTATEVLDGLAIAALAAGFTESHDTENITINKNGESLQMLKVDTAANTKVVTDNQSIQWDLATMTFTFNGASGDEALYNSVDYLVLKDSTYPEIFDGKYTIVSVTIDGSDLDIVVSEAPDSSAAAFNSDVIVYPNNVIGVTQPTDSFAFDWWSSYAFGVEYFDEKGRTMGVVTQREMSVQTIPYADGGTTEDVYLPKIGLSISQRPPLEAKYFHIVRTKNLTKSDFIQWISDHTYKDDEFAYISIEILNQYIVLNPQSNFLAWDFTPGDRIRFMKVLSHTPGVVTYTDKDYEIQASLTDPYINGSLKEGQILKIALPTTSDDFDFGSTLWDNYLIEIYTPARSVGDGLDVYYEFSERYMIGDAGLSTRFHQGMLQNQSTDLVTPATFEFIKGDNYFAQRTLNVGNVIEYSVDNDDKSQTGGAFNPPIGMTLISGYDVQDYIIQSQLFDTAGTFFIKIISGTFTFTINWDFTIRINSWDNSVVFLDLYYYDSSPHQLEAKNSPFVSNQILQYSGSTTVTRDSSSAGEMKLALLAAINPGDTIDITIVGGYISVKEQGKEFTVGIQNPNYSFFYESEVNSNGRPWVVIPDGRQSYNMAMMRYGLAYQQETNINQVNRFFSSQVDEYDRSRGDIRRFKFRQKQLKVFQASGVGVVGVYSQFITNSGGQTQLIYTTNIITSNNIQYYLGNWGMGDQSTSLVSNKNVDYFIDPVTGEHLRVSNDGITSLSKLYKGQFYISNLLTPYNFEWDRQDGSKAKILGVYDYFDEQCIFVLQGGSRNNGSETIEIDSYAFSFNEKRNAYCSFYDFDDAESLVAAENIVYSFLFGKLYKHNSETYCNFYGVQHSPSITLDFNGGEAAKKTFISLSYQANGVWSAPEIQTQLDSYGSTPQSSKLVTANFRRLEGVWHTSFKRDLNSRGGWVNGATLKGGYLIIRLVAPNDGGYYFINVISVKSIQSQLTNA